MPQDHEAVAADVIVIGVVAAKRPRVESDRGEDALQVARSERVGSQCRDRTEELLELQRLVWITAQLVVQAANEGIRSRNISVADLFVATMKGSYA